MILYRISIFIYRDKRKGIVLVSDILIIRNRTVLSRNLINIFQLPHSLREYLDSHPSKAMIRLPAWYADGTG
mgnify:CR=1 FL=1